MAQALAKFHSQVTHKLKRSAIVNVVESASASADHIDLAAPFSPAPVRSTVRRDGTPKSLVTQNTDGAIVEHDPLKAAVTKHKRRGTPRTEHSGRASEPPEPVKPPATTENERRAALRERLAKKGFTE